MTAVVLMTHATQRAAWCAAVAKINRAHLEFWCERNEYPAAPFIKLSNKLDAYLKGELKSLANLERFHAAFADWRNDLPEDDNLAYRIAELVCSALYSGVEAILDPECDDTVLLSANIEDLYQELASLSDHSNEMQEYWLEIQQALNETLADSKSTPVSREYFDMLKQVDTSLFGL